MLLLLPIIGQWQRFAQDMAQLKAKPFKLLIIILAGYIVTVNWGTFIYAIDAGFVLQTSLGIISIRSSAFYYP